MEFDLPISSYFPIAFALISLMSFVIFQYYQIQMLKRKFYYTFDEILESFDEINDDLEFRTQINDIPPTYFEEDIHDLQPFKYQEIDSRSLDEIRFSIWQYWFLHDVIFDIVDPKTGRYLGTGETDLNSIEMKEENPSAEIVDMAELQPTGPSCDN